MFNPLLQLAAASVAMSAAPDVTIDF
jgi:hypothetical protein